jgi:primosomal protein N' (replication factor Y) (superfamily II helicase)
LGPEVLGIWHSQISTIQKRSLWQQIQTGQKRVILGARSALFVPLPDLGLVVMDEVHDASFKQDMPDPRYDARTAAERLAKTADARLLMGSATPSIAQLFQGKSGRWTLLHLHQRHEARPLPPVALVTERPLLGLICLTPTLVEALQKTLQQGEQAMVLLNRRGFHTLLQCQDCGYSFHCPNCSVTLTFHQDHQRVRCHHCGYSSKPPEFCPKCAGVHVSASGAGTQRLRQELVEALKLPDEQVFRLDADVLRTPKAYQSILQRFAANEAPLLVGTQVIAKGLDFPNVTLVGVIQADSSLALPDYKAPERTFQLLTQVSGRSGRGAKPGKVLWQVLQASPTIQWAQTHDLESLYSQDLAERERFGYPPFGRLLRLLVSGEEEERVAFFAHAACTHLIEALRQTQGYSEDGVELLGPAPCLVHRVKRQWRYHTLIKLRGTPLPTEATDALAQAVVRFYQGLQPSTGIRVSLDVDPETCL